MLRDRAAVIMLCSLRWEGRRGGLAVGLETLRDGGGEGGFARRVAVAGVLPDHQDEDGIRLVVVETEDGSLLGSPVVGAFLAVYVARLCYSLDE